MKYFVVFTVLVSTLDSVKASTSRPEIVDDILPEVKQQGQTGYLNCSVINLAPPAELQWVKKTTPTNNPLLISSNENVADINYNVDGRRKYDIKRLVSNNREQYQLIIRALTENDAGEYVCQIRMANQNYLTWPKKIGLLTVQIAPTIKADSPSNIVVSEGANITLKCDANGIPAPNITWKRGDGLPLPGGGFQYWGSEYQIISMAATDRGQFLCIADNNVRPPADYAVQIEVLFAPYCKAQQDTVGQVQNRRFSAKMDCIVAANPRAEVKWYKANTVTGKYEQINDNDKYNLDQQDDQRLKADEKWYSLTIKTVQGNDFGRYYCHAENRFGKGNASFIVFETMECQGPLCPSIGGATHPVQLNVTSAPERHDVSCESESISVFVPTSLLSHTDHLTWRDPHCKVPSNTTHFISSISHTECGTTVIFTNDEVIFQNELIIHSSGANPTDGAIDFGKNNPDIIPVKCVYPRRQNITTAYRPAQSHVRFYEKRYGHLDVEMVQYESEKFEKMLPSRTFPMEVEINKDIFLKLHAMHTKSADVAIKVDSCVATPSISPADSLIYQLIDHGCAASPAIKIYNSSFDEFRFSVKAFEFRSKPGSIVYIHCQVSVCSPTSPGCVTGCASRHRREAVQEEDSAHLVSGGPYLLIADKGSLQMSTVVAAVCACLAVVATVVAIIGWRRKARDTSSALNL